MIEVIIAISILMVVIGASSGIYTNGIRIAAMGKNDLVAAGLAEDGIEMVRNMRDTNFLKFSSRAIECWNTNPSHLMTGLDNCDLDKIGDENDFGSWQNFRLTLDVGNMQWGLEVAVAADLSGATYNLKWDSETGLYATTVPPATAGDSIFNRQISIKYVDLDAGIPGAEAMIVASKVSYDASGQSRTLTRATILSNQKL